MSKQKDKERIHEKRRAKFQELQKKSASPFETKSC